MNPILVTGGAGFIGSEFVRQWISEETAPVINLDKLTYAGNLDSLESVSKTHVIFLSRAISVTPNAFDNFSINTTHGLS